MLNEPIGSRNSFTYSYLFQMVVSDYFHAPMDIPAHLTGSGKLPVDQMVYPGQPVAPYRNALSPG